MNEEELLTCTGRQHCVSDAILCELASTRKSVKIVDGDWVVDPNNSEWRFA